MKKTVRTIIAALLIFAMLLPCTVLAETPSTAAEAPSKAAEASSTAAEASKAAEAVTCGIYEIDDHGNVTLDLYAHQLDEKGYGAGDIVQVTIGEKSWQMPYGTGYSDVNPGYMVLISKRDTLVLGINQKSFADETGLSEADASVTVTISMDEKGGYLHQYEVRNMAYTDSRDDYDSDEVFANFREITMGGIPAGLLYRSASGIDDSHKRPASVNALCEASGIRTVVNLAQSSEELETLAAEASEKTFYTDLMEKGQVIAGGSTGIDITSVKFKTVLAEDLRKMLDSEGPYVIQCKEGKDRTGAVCILLESLMGASYEEMLDDYMQSFVNYYHLEKGDERYQAVKDGNADYLFMTLSETEHVSDMEKADYTVAAISYLLDAGMTIKEIGSLRTILSGGTGSAATQ